MKLKNNIDCYYKAMGMLINTQKSSMSFFGLDEEEVSLLSHLFPYQQTDLENGIKYLGFMLKCNVPL
jgi:hypothetical protein